MEMPLLLQANCAGTDTESFFPGTNLTSENQAAKRVCERCVERDPCLQWALRHELHGIWGGTTGGDRVSMRRELGISYSAPEVSILQRMSLDG